VKSSEKLFSQSNPKSITPWDCHKMGDYFSIWIINRRGKLAPLAERRNFKIASAVRLEKVLLCSILRECLESFLFWQFQYLFHQSWCPSSRPGMGQNFCQLLAKAPTNGQLVAAPSPPLSSPSSGFWESLNLAKNYVALRNLWSIEQAASGSGNLLAKAKAPCACKHIGCLRGYLRALFAVCHWWTGGPICKGPCRMAEWQ